MLRGLHYGLLTALIILPALAQDKVFGPANWVLPSPAPLEDPGQQEARTIYLELLDRQLRVEWEKFYRRTIRNQQQEKAVSRFDLGYFSALAYRASLLDANDFGQRRTQAALLAQCKPVLEACISAINRDDPLMAAEFWGGLNSLCRLYTILRDHGVLSAVQQQAALAAIRKAPGAALEARMERGAFNRPASMAFGLAAALQLLPDSPEAPQWRTQLDAVWKDFIGPGDTFEDASGYNGLFSYGIVHTAQLTGQMNVLASNPKFEKMWDRMAAWTAPNGALPDFGNTYFMHAAPYWIDAWERLGSLYKRGDFQDNGLRIAKLLLSQKNFSDYELEPLSEAIEGLSFRQPVPANRPMAEVTTRRTDWGDVVPDKLILRAASSTGVKAFVCVDLHDGGYHGHQDGGALSLYTLGGSVLLHELGRPAVSAVQHQSTWASRPDLPFLTGGETFPNGEWVDAYINLRWPGTYVGAFTLDLRNVQQAFFRLQDISDGDIEVGLEVEGLWAHKAGKQEVKIAGPWKDRANFSAGKQGESRFINSSKLTVSDLSPYDSLRVRWKISDNRSLTPYGYFGLKGAALNGGPDDESTFRAMAAQPVRDAWIGEGAAGGFQREMVDALGRKIRHRRNLLLSDDGKLEVVDRFAPEIEGDYVLGPVWHMQKILGAGEGWIIGRDDAQRENFSLPPIAVKFTFSSSLPLKIQRAQWETAHAQREHFSATISKHLQAGEEVIITSRLEPQ